MFCEDNLAKNIKKYRLQKNMTQTQLAEKLFVTPQTVSKWEKALAIPALDKLCSVAEIFGVPTDMLLRGGIDDDKKAMIAIDGGGTKTEFVLFCEDGKVLSRLVLSGSNPNVYGIDGACSTLKQGIDAMLAAHDGVSGIFAGVAGCVTGQNGEKVTEFLAKTYPGIKIRVTTDIECVMGCVREKKCIAAICGTGSIAYASDGEKLYRAGGWGYLFDPAGSGYDMGRDAIMLSLEVDNGFLPSSPLVEEIENSIGGRVFDKLDEFYAKGKDYIASFARIVMQMHDADERAAQIVEKSVKRLAYLINQLYTAHDCGNMLVMAGGMTNHKTIFEKLLKKHLEKGIVIHFPKLPPVYGACMKCMDMCGINFDKKEFDKKFEADYGQI